MLHIDESPQSGVNHNIEWNRNGQKHLAGISYECLPENGIHRCNALERVSV